MVIGFEELLSELIARARKFHLHLGSRLVSAMLTYGVRCRTLSCEERNQLARRPLPSSRSARVPLRAYNRCTARSIPRSWLQERERCYERGYLLLRRNGIVEPSSLCQTIASISVYSPAINILEY